MRRQMRHVTIAMRDLDRSTAFHRDLLDRRDGIGIQAIGASAPLPDRDGLPFEVMQ